MAAGWARGPRRSQEQRLRLQQAGRGHRDEGRWHRAPHPDTPVRERHGAVPEKRWEPGMWRVPGVRGAGWDVP